MRVKLYVTINKSHARTPAGAAAYTQVQLEDDQTFCLEQDPPFIDANALPRGRFQTYFTALQGAVCDFFDVVAEEACLVDAAVYETHLKQHEGTSDNQTGDFFTFVDLDEDVVSPSFIGTKWLVPMWYHF